MPRFLLRCLLLVLLPLLAWPVGAASSRRDALDQAQYAWSEAIRWGDFERAWGQVDPEVRAAHPLTDIDFSRYKQLQVAGYRDLGSSVVGGSQVQRRIEITVVNRNTQQVRTVLFQERWRFDPASKTWWQTSGLPDFWQDPD
ncbi:hypothetical protein [Thermomonas sp.]|uniref:hypothetical protein n=1 Tax=Thermomonas sp. TaxID=1971895 RepID=UPI003D151782